MTVKATACHRSRRSRNTTGPPAEDQEHTHDDGDGHGGDGSSDDHETGRVQEGGAFEGWLRERIHMAVVARSIHDAIRHRGGAEDVFRWGRRDSPFLGSSPRGEAVPRYIRGPHR